MRRGHDAMVEFIDPTGAERQQLLSDEQSQASASASESAASSASRGLHSSRSENSS